MTDKQQRFIDLPRILFSLMFIGLMLIGCLWILRPFLPSLIWATMVVIATWPLMKKLEHIFGGRRYLATATMTMLILLLFVIPVALLVSSVVQNSATLVKFSSIESIEIPTLEWVKEVPYVGDTAFNTWQSVIASNGKIILNQIQPYIGQGLSWLASQAANLGRFLIYSGLMVIFSALLYQKGEVFAESIRHFAFRLAGVRGDTTVILAGQAIRAVALGVVVTALAQSLFAGIGLVITGIPAATILMLLIFLLCVAQLGPLIILVPAVIWLYWSGETTYGTVLLVWTAIVITMDGVLRPFLIKMGADLPMLLILAGVIGGLLSFGLIGLFIGPVLLAVSFRLLQAWIDEVESPDVSKNHQDSI